jgi:hypothetical protein
LYRVGPTKAASKERQLARWWTIHAFCPATSIGV